MTLYVFTHCPRSCLPWVAIPYRIALLPTSICSHWARLLARDDHAPLFLPRLWAFSLQRWGPWCVSHRDEELRALSGMRRSSTPSGSLFITEILKTVSSYKVVKVNFAFDQASAYLDFCGMKRLGIFPLPVDGMLVHCRATPSIKFVSTHLYTWVERGTVFFVRVECLAQEHYTMSPARNGTRTAQSGVECTNPEATALLHCINYQK